MVSQLFSWLLARLPSRRRFRVLTVVGAADEIPDRLPSRAAATVGTAERPSWIAFDCPCADHHRVMLNLDRSRRPNWTVTGTSPLTIRPSIDERRAGKRCHYFIRHGHVQWVPGKNPGKSR